MLKRLIDRWFPKVLYPDYVKLVEYAWFKGKGHATYSNDSGCNKWDNSMCSRTKMLSGPYYLLNEDISIDEDNYLQAWKLVNDLLKTRGQIMLEAAKEASNLVLACSNLTEMKELLVEYVEANEN